MSMIDDYYPQIETELEKLVKITGKSKLEIKILAYIGYTTDEIIKLK